MELLYHYIWKHRMIPMPARCCKGEQVEVLYPGLHNDNAGPDFSNASVCIDSVKWTGNVEIHVKASDWYAHGHHLDDAYDNVILHVVAIDDKRVTRKDGTEIPQLAVVLPRDFYITYSELSADMKGVRCASDIPSIPPLNREDWLETIAIERLHFKAQRILDWYHSLNCDWEQTMFTALARGLGFNLNGVPFELLAKSIPLNYLYRHSDSLMQIEALLFGQAGMLNGSMHIFDDYYQSLCREYGFLARKYGLRPMRLDLWKYARTRPQNFPHRRIALLAAAIYAGRGFTSYILDAKGNIDQLLKNFDWQLHQYWRDHFAFGAEGRTDSANTSLSAASRRLLLINVAAPFYYAYAQITGDYLQAEYGCDILSHLPPEKNSIITSWENTGLKPHNASRSQALLHLRSEYCDKQRCLNCRFGHHLLRKSVHSSCGLGS